MPTRAEIALERVELANRVFEDVWSGRSKADKNTVARNLAYSLQELRVAKSLEKEVLEENTECNCVAGGIGSRIDHESFCKAIVRQDVKLNEESEIQENEK